MSAAIASGFVIATLLNQPSLAEVLAEIIAGVTPLVVIEVMIQRFGSDAKHILFVAVLLGQAAAGIGLSALASRQRWSVTQLCSAAVLVVAITTALIAVALRSGSITSSAGNWELAVGSGAAASLVAYLLTYAACLRYLHPTGFFAPEEARSRRRFLRNAGATVAGLTLVTVSYRWVKELLEPPAVPARASAEASETIAALAGQPDLQDALTRDVPGLSSEITPNDAFYVVSKNFYRDPEVDPKNWRLEIIGSVERPAALTYDEVQALPGGRQFFTLQCISNEIGGELIGNAEWRGTSLAAILGRAGVRPSAIDVVFHAADGYTDSVPLRKAMQPDTMVAYEMNGGPLSRDHGFPVRMLIPDIYGMKNVKWVTKIEVVDYDFLGYWMTRGWGDSAIMNTSARIDLPRNGSYLRIGTNYVGGVAVAGQRGIARVEVSTDNGRTWQEAVVKPALGTNAWSRWLFRWEITPDTADPITILARAVDGQGTPQSAERRETIPDGATGYHAITVRRAQS